MNKLIEKLKDRKFLIHIITYLIVGGMTTVVSLGSFWLLRQFLPSLDKNIANAISIVLAIIFAYITNRKYVFKSTEKNKFKEFISFAATRMTTFFFDMACFYIFATVLTYNEMIVKIGISVAVVILNYVLSRFLVFNKEEKVSVDGK